MSNFDFMGFRYDGSHDEMFVANAKKYSAAQTVELCKCEYDYKFRPLHVHGKEIPGLREPTVDDVQNAHCAFRMGVSLEWPDGCYTLVETGERGAFPVHVIDFDCLENEV